VHQNICQVYHLGRFGKRYYIAMEFISGVNLKELIDRQAQLGLRVPPELGVFIVSRVCRALEYAHTKRDKRGEYLHVVHRDVSAKNVMISTEGEVKLTDFGVAKARRLMKAHEGRVRVGNALYMSPEQAKYQPTDGRSDLFSLGVVAFELLTGRQLFAGRSLKATLRNVLTMEIPSPREVDPEIPPSVERILLKTLERDVSRRYQSAGELGYELEYEIYHRGYGPTIVTLEKHMRALFPWLFVPGTERVRAVPAIDDAVLSAMSTIASGGWTMRAEESPGGERPSARSTAQERPRR
jgi:serine/threonine protein kinase